MPSFCAAFNCTNSSSKEECRKKNITFHRFPLKTPELLKIWLLKIRRDSFTPSKYSSLCSEHFEENSFKYQLFTNRRLIKEDAIPTVFSYLPPPKPEKMPPYKRKVFHQLRVCQHANKGNIAGSSKNENCTAKLDISMKKVNSGTTKNDSFLKQNSPVPAVIKYFPVHTHSTRNAETLRMLSVNDDVKEQFFKYFADGMTAPKAKEFHEYKLSLEDNFNERLANASVNPTMRQVYYLHDMWRNYNLKSSFNLCEKSTKKIKKPKKETEESDVSDPILKPLECIIVSSKREGENEEIAVLDHPLDPLECVSSVLSEHEEETEENIMLHHSLAPLECENPVLTEREKENEEIAVLDHPLDPLECVSSVLSEHEEETEENIMLHHSLVPLECENPVLTEREKEINENALLPHSLVPLECGSPVLNNHVEESKENSVLYHSSVSLECMRPILNEYEKGAEENIAFHYPSVLLDCTSPVLHKHNMEEGAIETMLEELTKCAWQSCTSYVAHEITKGLQGLKSKCKQQRFWDSVLMLLSEKSQNMEQPCKPNSVGTVSQNFNKSSVSSCVSQESCQINENRPRPTVIYINLNK